MKKSALATAAILLVASSSIDAQVAPPGRFQLRTITPTNACVSTAEGFGARLPYVIHERCRGTPQQANIDADFWWEINRQPDGTFQVMHSMSRRCATVARGVVFGPPAIDLRTCENPVPADQRFKLERTAGGTFRFITLHGKCWYWRNEAYGSEHIERDCGASTSFVLIPAI